QWRAIPSINPSTVNNVLSGVAAVSASDVWAVGGAGNAVGGFSDSTLVEHWTGTAWKLFSSPNLSAAIRNDLYAVSAISATDIWAVGSYVDSAGSGEFTLTEHWNGAGWSIVASPNTAQDGSSLISVSGTAGNDVWAVGSSVDTTANVSFAL